VDRFLHFSSGAKRRTAVRRFAVAFLFLALACQKSEPPAEATDTATTSTMVSNTGTAGTVSTLSDAEKAFIIKAAQGGMAEVALGSLAAQQGTDPGVKSFGTRMTNDHGKANDELKTLATNKGLTLPTDLDAEHKAKHDELSKKSGKDFDQAYMDDMVKDHEKDVAEFEKESTAARDPDLKAWVSKTLPTLQDHLKQAKEIAAKVK
jgi:putative membrane protein